MSTSIRFAVLSLIALVMLVGCEAPQAAAPAVAEPVAIVDRTLSQDSDLPHAGVWLIQSQAQLDAVGSQTLADLDVDFTQNDLAVVALGEQPTGGYCAYIKSVQQVGNTLYLTGIASSPAADMATTQQITNPYCAVVISKTSATTVRDDIKSVESSDLKTCPMKKRDTPAEG